MWSIVFVSTNYNIIAWNHFFFFRFFYRVDNEYYTDSNTAHTHTHLATSTEMIERSVEKKSIATVADIDQ